MTAISNQDYNLIRKWGEAHGYRGTGPGNSVIVDADGAGICRRWSTLLTLKRAEVLAWQQAQPATAARTAQAAGSLPRVLRGPRLFTLLPRTAATPATQDRYFCSACMATFDIPAGTQPTVCLEGHTDRPLAQTIRIEEPAVWPAGCFSCGQDACGPSTEPDEEAIVAVETVTAMLAGQTRSARVRRVSAAAAGADDVAPAKRVKAAKAAA